MALSDQEKFWKGRFGDNYINRNQISNRHLVIGKDLVDNRVYIKSAIELGPNIGLNLDGLKRIFPEIKTFGVEINKKAFSILKKKHPCANRSIINFKSKKKFDLVLITGVLMHQDPKNLKKIYKTMYDLTKKYIYISEYFNPKPIEILYHNERERLYKRDFAKEIWELYPNLKLINYGFQWKQDPFFSGGCDDTNWFIFTK